MFFSVVWFVAAVCGAFAGKYEPFNYTNYFSMPPLNQLDNYDRCLAYPDRFAAYCFVDVTIKPQPDSEIWTYIEHFSADQKRHFRHDRLQRGICINSCRALMDNFSETSREKYFLADFGPNITVRFGPERYKNSQNDGVKYNKLVNQCVNYELRKYGLRAYSTIEYCVTNEPNEPLDLLDWLFLLLTAFIIVLVVFASAVDKRRKRVYDSQIIGDVDYYGKIIRSKADKIVLAFSLPRNWQSLTFTRKNTRSFDLEFLDGIKFLMMQWIITGHNLIFRLFQPLENPEFFEIELQNNALILFMNGYSLVLTFFIISGAMQAIKYLKYMKQHKAVQWTYIGKSVIYRYIRYLPLYGFVILFHATVFVRMQDGPFWPRIQQPNQMYCRRNWWANLLFINNHYETTKQCMMESWFLAVDMQLHVISTIVLLIVWKFPQHKFKILLSVVFATTLIPGFVAYWKNLRGLLLLRPESAKYYLIDSQTYRYLYITAYSNLGSFFTGTFAIFLLQLIIDRNITIDWFRRYKLLFSLVFSVFFLTVASGFIFYKYDFANSSWINPLFVILQKGVWGVVAIITYLGLISKAGGFIRNFFKLKFFNILGKLSFSAYLCHLIVVQYMVDVSRQTLHMKLDTIWMSQVLAIVLSYCVALVLCLTIEYPAVVLQKLVFGSDEPEDKKPETEAEINRVNEMTDINTSV